jgi:hypothetical protein
MDTRGGDPGRPAGAVGSGAPVANELTKRHLRLAAEELLLEVKRGHRGKGRAARYGAAAARSLSAPSELSAL